MHTGSPAPRLLLGPQRPHRNLDETLAGAGLPPGPLAVISAGWQEAEADIDDVREAVGRTLVDLRLYHRAEEVFAAEPELAALHRARQDALKSQQRLYRSRLRRLSVAAREMFRATGEHAVVGAERRHAVAQLRALDRHHLKRTVAVHREYAHRLGPAASRGVAMHAEELARLLDDTVGVLITGGNIVVLLNRLRLFGLERHLRDRPIVAWSAGAMVLAERIVLFHDRMPQGPRDPEVLGAGLGLVGGVVLLPDAAHRLRDQERLRAGLMSRRFAPDVCLALDSGNAVTISGRRTGPATGVRRLGHDGRYTPLVSG